MLRESAQFRPAKALADSLPKNGDPREVSQVSTLYLTGSIVGCRGLGANQRVRSAGTLGHVCEVTAIAIDNFMQMPATILAYRETVLAPVRIRQKAAQFSTITAAARQCMNPPIISRLSWSLGGVFLQPALTGGEPVRNQPIRRGQPGQSGLEGEDRGQMRAGQIVFVVTIQRMIDHPR